MTMKEALEPDWINANTCIENAEIAYEDSIEDEDGPVDTVISSGDLGVLIGLAKYAAALRASTDAAPVAWMYRRDDGYVDVRTDRLPARMPPWDDKWTETPLYAHPPVPDAAPIAESEDEHANCEGMDRAADFCIRTLAKALDVDDWQQADGSETWDGDVAGTIYNVLKSARVYDDEDGRIARLEDVTGSNLDHDAGLVTPAEAAVIRALVNAWKLFLQIPTEHPDQQLDFRHGIHALQHMIFARPAIRWWNLAAQSTGQADG